MEKQNVKTKDKSPQRPLQWVSPTPGTYNKDKSHRAITIEDKTPEEVYLFWRDLKNLTFFMMDVYQIEVMSERKSHWVIKLKNGMKVQWDAEITEDLRGKMIAWKSVPESQVTTKGSVWFSKGEKGGTVVSLAMDYTVPGGKITELITMLRGEDPDSLAQTNLRRLKAYLETGEIPTTEGQPSGREEYPSITRH